MEIAFDLIRGKGKVEFASWFQLFVPKSAIKT